MSTRTVKEMVSADMKLIEAGSYPFAIAQAEFTDLVQRPLMLAA